MSGHDDERDAWLAQALRHAPDANADAPPSLTETILREARAAAVTPAAQAAARHAAPGPLQWLASAWDWLARPPVAAGFASVMVATLVGVMWWDQPLDENLPRAPEVVSATPQARAEVVPPAVVAAALSTRDAQPVRPESTAPAPETPTGALAAQARLADKNAAEKSARVSRAAEEPAPARSAADTAPAVAAAAPPPAAFPAAPQAAATTNEAVSPSERRRESPAPAAKALAESPAPAATDRAASPHNDLRALQGAADPAALAKARAADADDTPLAPLRNRIAQQPERWRWQRGAGSPQAMTAAVQGWLAEVDRQTVAHWQAGAKSTAPEPANTLRLFRDGALQATLGLAGAGVWIEASTASVATLPEGAAESLRKALAEATP